MPTLAEVCALLPADVALALELKTDRFLEPEVCRRLIAGLHGARVHDRVLVLSFSLPCVLAMRAVAPDVPGGWITLSRPWPLPDAQVLGPFWPLLVMNPAYVCLAHRRRQLVCPLDPTPDSRLWLYRVLGCDAALTDGPGKTCRALRRS